MRIRVLVIDDERSVAEAVRNTLKAEHDVIIESDPSVALAQLRAGAPYDVILCDLDMPTLSGLALHAELARTRPDLAARIVFLAGSFARYPMPDIPNRRIGKPFQTAILREVVADVASGEPPRAHVTDEPAAHANERDHVPARSSSSR